MSADERSDDIPRKTAPIKARTREWTGDRAARPAYRGPPLLLEIVDHFEATVRAHLGIDATVAREMGKRVAIAIADRYGRAFHWFPRPRGASFPLSWFEITERDREIAAAAAAHGEASAAEQFRMPVLKVNEIAGRVRVEDRATALRTPEHDGGIAAPQRADNERKSE